VPDRHWAVIQQSVLTAAAKFFGFPSRALSGLPDGSSRRSLLALRAKWGGVMIDGPTTPVIPTILHTRRARIKLEHVTKKIKILQQQWRDQRNSELIADLSVAWEARDFSTMWRSARQRGGKSIGSKNRFRASGSKKELSVHDWEAKVSLSGPDGGCAAVPLPWEAFEAWSALTHEQQRAVPSSAPPVSRTDLGDPEGRPIFSHDEFEDCPPTKREYPEGLREVTPFVHLPPGVLARTRRWFPDWIPIATTKFLNYAAPFAKEVRLVPTAFGSGGFL
jgi:hypothetical protein